jgi:CheY-like chemotaxis protein
MQKPNRDILSGWLVLVVDDDAKSLDVVGRILSHYGATVHSAENGQAGLELAKKLKPKLIVSDLSMPEMDGWEFMSQLRKQAELSQIPVIALTAHVMTGDRERVLAAGFSGYLGKPIAPATFITDLLAWLKDIPDLGLTWSG